MRRPATLISAAIAVALVAPVVPTPSSETATAAPSLAPETFGMRASGGFADPDRVEEFESALGRPLNWYVAMADRRNVGHMRGSVRGQVKDGSVLGERSGDINVVMTMPLAFGTGNARTAAGRASIKRRLIETASGRWDADFRTAAQSLIDGGHANAVIRLGHEFTGAWYPWSAQGNANEYIAAYRHIHDVMAAESSLFRFEWNAARNTFGEYGPEAYPGDEYVDIISMDVYYEPWKGDPAPLTADIWRRRYAQPMGTHLEFAEQHGKQVAYSEWANGLVDEPRFIEWMHDWFLGLPAEGGGSLAYQSYFNASNDKYNLNKYPKSKAAYLRLFGDSTNSSGSGSVAAPSGPIVDVPERLDAVAGSPTQIPATIVSDTVQWWKVSGSSVSWDRKDIVNPTVTFSKPGTYVLRVRARNLGDDSAVAASITVDVAASEAEAPQPPTEEPGDVGVQVSVRDASGVEGSKLVFKFVASSAAVADITIDYVVADITTTPADYHATKTGSIVIPKGSKYGYLGVPTVSDGAGEPDEEFRVRIESIDGASIGDGTATGMIRS